MDVAEWALFRFVTHCVDITVQASEGSWFACDTRGLVHSPSAASNISLQMAIKAFVFLYVLLNYAVLNGHASITASELSVRSSMAASGAVLWVKVKNGNCLVTCTKFADMQPVGAGKGPNEEFPSLVCGVKNPTTGSLIAGKQGALVCCRAVVSWEPYSFLWS